MQSFVILKLRTNFYLSFMRCISFGPIQGSTYYSQPYICSIVLSLNVHKNTRINVYNFDYKLSMYSYQHDSLCVCMHMIYILCYPCRFYVQNMHGRYRCNKMRVCIERVHQNVWSLATLPLYYNS